MPKLPPIGADVSDFVSGGSLPPIGGEVDADPINQPTPHERAVPRADVRLDDTPGMFGSAGRRELLRTGTEAAIGLARSPLDAVKGLFGMVAHPIDTATNLASSVAHPLDTIEALGDDPRAAGSLLGQVLMGRVAGPKVGAVARASAPALAEGAASVGRGVGAVGRGLEVAGASEPVQKAAQLGGLHSILNLDPRGVALAAAPTALKYGGKAVQAGGRLLERAPSAMDSLMGNESLDAVAAGRQNAWRRGTGARQSSEVPYRYADEAAPVAEDLAATPEPMSPWSPGEGAWNAAEDVAPPAAAVAEDLAPSAAPNWIRPKPLPMAEADLQRLLGGRSTTPDPIRDAARAAGDRRLASMAALEDGPAAVGGVAEDLADELPGLSRDQFHDRFLRQMMESLDRR